MRTRILYFLDKDENENPVEIPNFVVSNTQSDLNELPLLKVCESENVVTPTPAKEPVKKIKKIKLPVLLVGWDTANKDTSLHFTSSQMQFNSVDLQLNKIFLIF